MSTVAIPSRGRSGGPLDLDRHPGGGGQRFDQFERSIRAGVGEQPRALSDDHGEREQGDLVDKVVVEQQQIRVPMPKAIPQAASRTESASAVVSYRHEAVENFELGAGEPNSNPCCSPKRSRA